MITKGGLTQQRTADALAKDLAYLNKKFPGRFASSHFTKLQTRLLKRK